MDNHDYSPAGWPRRRAACEIRPDESGLSLLDFLASRFAYHSLGEWRNLLGQGRILINNGSASRDVELRICF